MQHPIIPSGSLEVDVMAYPNWAKPTRWLPVEIGCLARILPLGGPVWMNELVLVIEIMKDCGSTQLYKVYGRHGEAVFPYYALDVQSTCGGGNKR